MVIISGPPGAADSLRSEVDGLFNAVGNLNEGNTAVHPILLTVKSRCSIDGARTCPLAGDRKC